MSVSTGPEALSCYRFIPNEPSVSQLASSQLDQCPSGWRYGQRPFPRKSRWVVALNSAGGTCILRVGVHSFAGGSCVFGVGVHSLSS